MTKMKSLNDVFVEELSDLYSAEQQLVKALPKMVEAVTSPKLKTTIEGHLEETRNQVARLEDIFATLGLKPHGITCKAMKGLIEESEEVIKKSDKGAARDAAIIGAAQRVEHYEIAGYGTAQSHASLLGQGQIKELLSETLEEEKGANSHLNDLAEGSINSLAMNAA